MKSHVPKLHFKLVRYRSILTRLGLNRPGSKPSGSKLLLYFSIPDQTGPGVYLAFCTRGTGSLPGKQADRACRSPPTAHGTKVNPLNPELNPICYLLELLGVHHFLHVSRIRVKLLTLRLLMPYIYIYIYIWSTHS